MQKKRKRVSWNVWVGGYHFRRKVGCQIYKKSASIKLQPPYFGNKKFSEPPPPHHQYTLPPEQAEIVLKSVFLKQNKQTICGHFVTPYILVIKNFMIPD